MAEPEIASPEEGAVVEETETTASATEAIVAEIASPDANDIQLPLSQPLSSPPSVSDEDIRPEPEVFVNNGALRCSFVLFVDPMFGMQNCIRGGEMSRIHSCYGIHAISKTHRIPHPYL